MRTSRKFLALPVAGLALGFAFLATPTQTAAAGDGADQKTERLWKSKCSACHGKDGKGETKKGKKMKVKDMTTAAWQKEVTDARMLKAMNDGIERTEGGVEQKMKPVKGKISPEEMQALIKFMRAFKK